MKNPIAYILIALISFPLILVELALCYELHSVRKEVKRSLILGLEEHELISFEFSKEEFEGLDWHNDNEFELDRLMYDVVKCKIVDNTVFLICFPDKQETELNQRLESLRKLAWSSHVPSKQEQNKIIHFLKNLYYAPAQRDSTGLMFVERPIDLYSLNNYQAYLSIGTPPPELWF